MIRSFADKHTQALFGEGVWHRSWRMIEKVALRKLDQLNNVAGISDEM
jgi:plasmid maintenance system killer protein